ncbi:MAG: DUF401 family protein [Kiritimatiellia bacterium]|nr:DUF401 family protein [Kiritimatiellia bacterium]
MNIMSIPAAIKTIIVFASMLVLARFHVPLGIALVAGGVALNFWAGLAAFETFANVGFCLREPEFWLLIAVTALIIELGKFMTEKGNADELVAATQRWGGRHGRAATLMAMPAMIGLIPMPAGALFSAPFVQQAGEGEESSSEWKCAVNYWFRHIWEYWWPLYPGVILTMSIFEIEAARFIAAQFLFTVVAVSSGYLFLVKPRVKAFAHGGDAKRGSNRRAAFLLVPLVVVVASLFILPPCFERLFPDMHIQTRKLLAVLAGLLAGHVVIICDGRNRTGSWPSVKSLCSALLEKRSINVLFTLSGVLIFKGMLDRAGLLPLASEELINSGIPIVLAVAILPFLAGVVTGLTLGFAGISFPLVVGLIATPGSGLSPLSTLVLAYGFGYMGMMVSPVHLCLLVTKDYFGSHLADIYRQILPCVLSVATYATIAHCLFHLLGW